jgi:hypothetical protein
MKPATKLVRRGYILGYRRARARARMEMDSVADEIEALREDFAEIVEIHHHARAIDEAIVERATTPDDLLN